MTPVFSGTTAGDGRLQAWPCVEGGGLGGVEGGLGGFKGVWGGLGGFKGVSRGFQKSSRGGFQGGYWGGGLRGV